MPRVRQYWKSYGRQFYADNIFTDVVEQIIEEIEQRPTVWGTLTTKQLKKPL